MKKILVTGSCGFIFSNFIRYVLYSRSDVKLVSIDKVLHPNTLHNRYINKNHVFYIGDVADAHFVETVFSAEKPDYVIHGAAQSHVDNSIADSAPFINSNVLGTQVITNACVKHKIDRLIYISTDEVYGQLSVEDNKQWTEDSPIDPRNPYSASKAAGELIVKAAHATYGLPYNITRSCNNFGPRQLPEKLIPKIIKNVLDGKKVPIYGQGQQLREWIHVDDKCSAILTIMDKAPANEIYNISSGYELSSLEMFQKVCNEMGTGHELLTFVEDRLGHDFRYVCDSSKLRQLGWSPQVKFTDGLKNCVSWYLNNKWFLR